MTDSAAQGHRRFVAIAMRAANRLRHVYWRLRGRTIQGVMALCRAEEGGVILVRHTYVDGWCLPGGMGRAGEHPVAAALRELREEIGLCRWREARQVATVNGVLDGVAASVTLILVEQVEFEFRRSLEIEAAQIFAADQWPDDMNGWSRKILEAADLIQIADVSGRSPQS